MKDKELLVYPQKEEDENFNKGLTLRDYFAAKSMAALLTGAEVYSSSDVASQSYVIADKMIKARKGSSPS